MLRRVSIFLRNLNMSAQLLAEIRDGIANQSSLLTDRLTEIKEGIANQSSILNVIQTELTLLVEIKELLASDSKSEALRQHATVALNEKLESVARILDQKLEDIIGTQALRQDELRQLAELRIAIVNQSRVLNDRLTKLAT
jgi:hypothetical protein